MYSFKPIAVIYVTILPIHDGAKSVSHSRTKDV